MEFFEVIYKKIFEILYADYIIAVILFTYLIIKYIFPNKATDTKRAAVNALVGIVFGAAWYYITDYSPINLMISLLTTVTIYQWFVKFLLKKLGIGYKDTDPELIKTITKTKDDDVNKDA